jgi:hypothetical protein
VSSEASVRMASVNQSFLRVSTVYMGTGGVDDRKCADEVDKENKERMTSVV